MGICLVFLLSLFFFNPTFSLLPEAPLNDDILGLIVFKANLRDSRERLSSWNEDDVTPCKWVGVRCDNKTNAVVELDLEGFSLYGKIGRGLLQLKSLRKLSLSRNNFSGSVSSLLVGLENLAELDLSQNNFSGNLEDSFFGECRSLRWISLAGNSISGKIPPSLRYCSSLKYLNFSKNLFEGEIERDFWSLDQLRSLDLRKNMLIGEIPDFGSRSVGLIGSIEAIDLGGNFLQGGLPESMRNLSELGSLRLDGNLMSGLIPPWIGELKNLEVLDLSRNQFFGSVPESIGELKLIKEINLSENRLNGTLPESFSECKMLKTVDFSGNDFTGEIPKWVLQNSSISSLDLSTNGFSGEISDEIGEIWGLQKLNLSGNWFSGLIPASIGKLRGVRFVDLSENKLSGRIPGEIAQASSLSSLWLRKNYLTGEIPAQIAACTSLTSLILSHNNLSGTIPETLISLTHLQTLDLSSNSLNGSLPKFLIHLPNLLVLNISNNLFSGTIPNSTFFNTIPFSSLSGNPSLCGHILNVSCPVILPKPIVLNPNSSSTSSSSSSSSNQKKIILSISALIAIAAAALISLGVVAITVLNFRVRSKTKSFSNSMLSLSDESSSTSPISGKLVIFSGQVPDFSAGTHAVLNKDCELGRGGFGSVYKTHLRDGRPVAIKKLIVSSLVKSQEEFAQEVKKLGKILHPNIITMEGYYWTSSLQLLIYEFISGGSLNTILHDTSSKILLSWMQRFEIILDMARGLSHLHSMNVVHYNLKANNVLLDLDTWRAKIGDSGLAKLLPMLDRYVLGSKIQSSLGYTAPEFGCPSVKITEKCDVYGFGVLVLEVVTGKKPVEYMEDDVVMLCDVVREALEEGRVEECVDKRLGGEFVAEEAVPVLKLGLICTSQVPSNRPVMGDVVNILELIKCPQGVSSPGEEINLS